MKKRVHFKNVLSIIIFHFIGLFCPSVKIAIQNLQKMRIISKYFVIFDIFKNRQK